MRNGVTVEGVEGADVDETDDSNEDVDIVGGLPNGCCCCWWWWEGSEEESEFEGFDWWVNWEDGGC